MSGWGEDVGVEVEALQATYGEELLLDEQHQQVSMVMMPAMESSQHFVQFQLLLSVTPQYPQELPGIELVDVKGFTNRQDQLMHQLTTEASGLAGELLLGLLFESAKTWLAEHNHPEGMLSACCAWCCMLRVSALGLPLHHALLDGSWQWQLLVAIAAAASLLMLLRCCLTSIRPLVTLFDSSRANVSRVSTLASNVQVVASTRGSLWHR